MNVATFWFIFCYGLLALIALLVIHGLIDSVRRLFRPPATHGQILYSELSRPVRINRFPFYFRANIAVTANEIVIEPRTLYEAKGQKSLPKVVLDLSHVRKVRIHEGQRFTIRFEYPQKFGTALWGLGFQYPYSAYGCLTPPHEMTLSETSRLIAAQPDTSLR